MKKRTRSILEELNSIGLNRNTDLLIEQRGANLIESTSNLLKLIESTYDAETAGDLERKFINAVKSGDVRKFRRSVKKIVESKRNDSK